MALMILVMAGVTYLIRMIPFVFFRKKIKSDYLKSVLFYLPYAVLSAMTFPYIFYSTGNFYTALLGTVVAIIVAVFKRSLLTVAVCACLTALIFGFIL
ncbi:MAG: AzlD domain-containing protein [Clostridiales bacterium]|nr:AzlD domain-containing protein [Clostridiales bacterium]